MNSEVRRLITDLKRLDEDITYGVEETLIEEIPGWKERMVSKEVSNIL